MLNTVNYLVTEMCYINKLVSASASTSPETCSPERLNARESDRHGATSKWDSPVVRSSNTQSLQTQSRCPFFSLERIKTSGGGGRRVGGLRHFHEHTDGWLCALKCQTTTLTEVHVNALVNLSLQLQVSSVHWGSCWCSTCVWQFMKIWHLRFLFTKTYYLLFVEDCGSMAIWRYSTS